MTVKMTSVTRTQCVQNFSLSRYTRLRGKKKNTFQLVWNEELTCYPIGWPKCQRWYVSLEGRLIILRCNEKETWSMQRAAGQQGDKVTSPSAICLILYLLRYRSGCGGGEEASAVWWSYKDLTASAWSEAARSNFKGSHSPAEASRINERELWQKNPLKPPEGFPLLQPDDTRSHVVTATESSLRPCEDKSAR